MARAHGFTLVEMLVVVVIVGVLAGAVGLASGARGGAYALREEAERLARVVRLVADEAVLDNREYGLVIDAGGYQVRRHDAHSGRWQPVPDWQPHRLPDGMQLSLAVEGSELGLSAQALGRERPPQLLLSSAAQWTPFSARLHGRRDGGPVYHVQSDGLNDPQVSRVGLP